MKVEIINVGTEVLSGKTINTNGAFLAIELEKIGFDIAKVITVGDDALELTKEIDNFISSDYDVLITTGGLGPTHDDFTKEVLCNTLGLELVVRQEAIDLLDKYFQREYAKCNLKQTMYPKDAILLPNQKGTAMGAVLEKDKKTYCILVGPPFEMQPMVKDYLIPYLEKKIINQRVVSEYYVMGIGESDAEELLKQFYSEFKDVEVAPYASIGKIRYQITGYKKDIDYFSKANEKFRSILESYIVSTENTEIEELVFRELKRLGYTISFCESCTGGMLAAKLCNCSGASAVLKESYVTYSNESKIKTLNVLEKTIEDYGVVSCNTTQEMVTGLKKITGADVCVSVSGYAGPTGGTIECPVGTAWFTVYVDNKYYSEVCFYPCERNLFREKVTMFIYFYVFKLLKERKK